MNLAIENQLDTNAVTNRHKLRIDAIMKDGMCATVKIALELLLNITMYVHATQQL